ncbi:hypothetical protein IEN85_02515 [Pelagicoccus sp. NFK12]|uniref:Alkylhydroperoxidase family enzyme, contains CxxC motif n=1 Tax=Pelagicoccus enzymogenes TaxID=2773457 RepID=A0A927IGG5_9BACT|nr:hypothetical protein [Pelagicoccus enzymogenes]MBD5778365.1 hypothetical protein [Pelagicoccus enzymogenes]
MFENESRISQVNTEALPAPLRLELQKLAGGARSLEGFLQVLANAPLMLEAYLVFGNALDKCSLSEELQAKLFLAIGELASSSYDVSAATSRAKALGISEEEIKRARCGLSDFPLHRAALAFARQLIRKHGHLTDEELNSLRRSIHDERTIVEIVAAVAQVHFASLLNNLANTPLDHPPAQEIRDLS